MSYEGLKLFILGPVTVPIILSIGIGVSAQQEFRKHQQERETRLLQRRNSKLNTNDLIIEEEGKINFNWPYCTNKYSY